MFNLFSTSVVLYGFDVRLIDVWLGFQPWEETRPKSHKLFKILARCLIVCVCAEIKITLCISHKKELKIKRTIAIGSSRKILASVRVLKMLEDNLTSERCTKSFSKNGSTADGTNEVAYHAADSGSFCVTFDYGSPGNFDWSHSIWANGPNGHVWSSFLRA